MQSDELGSLHNELISFQLNFIVNLDQPNIQIIKCNLNVTHIEFIQNFNSQLKVNPGDSKEQSTVKIRQRGVKWSPMKMIKLKKHHYSGTDYYTI